MQEPQYRAPGVHELLDAVAKSRVPCMSIMNMPPLPYVKRIPGLNYDALNPAYTDPTVWDSFDPATLTLCSLTRRQSARRMRRSTCCRLRCRQISRSRQVYLPAFDGFQLRKSSAEVARFPFVSGQFPHVKPRIGPRGHRAVSLARGVLKSVRSDQ